MAARARCSRVLLWFCAQIVNELAAAGEISNERSHKAKRIYQELYVEVLRAMAGEKAGLEDARVLKAQLDAGPPEGADEEPPREHAALQVCIV